MEQPKRKKIRLKEWDYSQNGCYFITFCTKDRVCLFWDTCRGAPCAPAGEAACAPTAPFSLTAAGEAVKTAVERIPVCYPSTVLERYVIMPNHVHMLITLQAHGGRTRCAPTVSHIVKQTKGAVTKHIGYPVWQKSYYDHIVRDESDFQRIWRYIDTNPLRWKEDRYYPADSAAAAPQMPGPTFAKGKHL